MAGKKEELKGRKEKDLIKGQEHAEKKPKKKNTVHQGKGTPP